MKYSLAFSFLFLLLLTTACDPDSKNPGIGEKSPTPADSLYAQIQRGEVEVLFHAMGTEPFWDVMITKEELLHIEFDSLNSYRLETAFDSNKTEQKIKFGDQQSFTILKEPGNDGMSDRTYPYTVIWDGNMIHPRGGGDARWMNDFDLYEPEPSLFDLADYFICYNSDANSSLALSIGFDPEGKAIFAKYQGQDGELALTFQKEDYQEGPAYPTIDEYYDEILDGKVNGTYKLTHSGAWDYAVYTSAKDGKTYSFTINHDLTVEGGEYRSTPCY